MSATYKLGESVTLTLAAIDAEWDNLKEVAPLGCIEDEAQWLSILALPVQLEGSTLAERKRALIARWDLEAELRERIAFMREHETGDTPATLLIEDRAARFLDQVHETLFAIGRDTPD